MLIEYKDGQIIYGVRFVFDNPPGKDFEYVKVSEHPPFWNMKRREVILPRYDLFFNPLRINRVEDVKEVKPMFESVFGGFIIGESEVWSEFYYSQIGYQWGYGWGHTYTNDAEYEPPKPKKHTLRKIFRAIVRVISLDTMGKPEREDHDKDLRMLRRPY